MAQEAVAVAFLAKYLPGIATAFTIGIGAWVKSIHTRMIVAESKIERLEGYEEVIRKMTDKFDELQRELGTMHGDIRVISTIIKERERRERQ